MLADLAGVDREYIQMSCSQARQGRSWWGAKLAWAVLVGAMSTGEALAGCLDMQSIMCFMADIEVDTTFKW